MLDADTLRVVRRWPVGDLVGSVSPDGRLFALASEGGEVRLLVLRSGRIRPFHGRHAAAVRRMRFTPDERTLVTSGGDGEVIAWDVGRGQVRDRFSGHSGEVWGLDVSSDGRTVYSAALDARATVWDLSGDRRLDRRFVAGVPFVADDGDGYPIELALTPDGRTLALTQDDGSVNLVDTRTLRRRGTLRAMPGFAAAVDYSPDGRLLAVTGKGGRVTLWDAARYGGGNPAGSAQHVSGTGLLTR